MPETETPSQNQKPKPCHSFSHNDTPITSRNHLRLASGGGVLDRQSTGSHFGLLGINGSSTDTAAVLHSLARTRRFRAYSTDTTAILLSLGLPVAKIILGIIEDLTRVGSVLVRGARVARDNRRVIEQL